MRNLPLSWLPGALGAVLVGGCASDHKAREAVDASLEGAEPAEDAAAVTDPGEDEPAAALDGGASEAGPDASDGPDAAAASQPDAAEAGPTNDSLCDPNFLEATPVLPELMIVLDRSQSMTPLIAEGVNCALYDTFNDTQACLNLDQAACDRLNCAGVDCTLPPYAGSVVCGGNDPSPAVERWKPAVQGLKSVTQQFEDELSFGLTLFPGDAAGMSSNGGDVCAPGSVRVPSQANNAPAIAQALDATKPSGATPLAATLTAVLEQLRARPGPQPRYLLLLTDGQPTCPNARGNTLDANLLAQDQALALQALDALRDAGIKTFVFGFVTPADTALATAVAELATHGGTGQFQRVKDAQSIVDAFAKIEPSLEAPCSLLLEGEHDARKLLVQLDDRALEPGDHWDLEGATLTLQGAACDKFSDGATHRVTVQEWCAPLAPVEQ